MSEYLLRPVSAIEVAIAIDAAVRAAGVITLPDTATVVTISDSNWPPEDGKNRHQRRREAALSRGE